MKSQREYSGGDNYPRALFAIVISVGLLAAFVTFTSWVLLSYPIGTTVRSYFYDVNQTRDFSSQVSRQDEISADRNNNTKASSVTKEYSEPYQPKNDEVVGQTQASAKEEIGHDKELNQSIPLGSGISPAYTQGVNKESDLGKGRKSDDNQESLLISVGNETTPVSTHKDNEKENLLEDVQPPSSAASNILNGNESNKELVKKECDLYQGQWIYDPSGPLYTNNSCPIITQMQNCQGNGRPDKEYENWRWKPAQCDLPRFDGNKFLDLMSGKTLAFIGDSVARNQMESLLCILWQVEVPKNRGNRHMQRWYFRSKSVMIVRIWSSWLVHQSPEPFSYAPEGVAKVYLDVPDERFMDYIPQFDVVVLSSGHWFAKQSVYILNNEIVGTQLWSPPPPKDLKVNNVDAFGISIETILTALATHPNYTGLTIVRSYSPDHYEGGAWNTGGSCTGKTAPLQPGQLVKNGFTSRMHEQQVTGYEKAVKRSGERSKKLKLMDITEVFSYRHDGHPGPFRNPDPNKKTQRGPDGRPPPQDCLHWCMPGPVDTWNELVLEIIRRELEDG